MLQTSFAKYTLVGIVVSIINIALLWLLIDILKLGTLVSATVVTGGMFLFKFYLYKAIGFSQ